MPDTSSGALFNYLSSVQLRLTPTPALVVGIQGGEGELGQISVLFGEHASGHEVLN
jgi:hypothetical protein